MAIDFSKFKKDPNAAKSNLQQTLDDSPSKSGFATDEGVWKPTVDKDGNGSALFRFIFDKTGKEFVELRNHGIKKNGKWFIDNCPKTLDWEKDCPVCEHADELKGGREWNKIPKAEQDAIRPFFGKTSYWCNIYIVKDPGCADNDGKVFKYRFGKKIADKIEKAMSEDPLDGTPGFSAFDPFNGANFKMVIKEVAGWRNYDDSTFAQPSAWLGGKQKEMEKTVENESFDLADITAPDQFKTYEELQTKFNTFLGLKAVAPKKPAPEAPPEFEEPMPEPDPTPDNKSEGKTPDPKEGAVDDEYFNTLIDDI